MQDIGLEISEMDFKVRKVEDGKVLVESDIYMTNEGRETSSDFRTLVKVREMDAGLLADKVWIQTGEIKPEATVIRSVDLTMPDQYNYIVEVLISEEKRKKLLDFCINSEIDVKRQDAVLVLETVKKLVRETEI